MRSSPANRCRRFITGMLPPGLEMGAASSRAVIFPERGRLGWQLPRHELVRRVRHRGQCQGVVSERGDAWQTLHPGGAWNEPGYRFNETDARSPFERSADFWVPLRKVFDHCCLCQGCRPVLIKRRDYSLEKPVSDQLFQVYKSLYSYDKTPLHALVESTKQADDWQLQTISFDAAYGNERMKAYLFLPKKATPPYQTIVYFPASGAIYTRIPEPGGPELEVYDFIIKSGRAVIVPVFKGTYDRDDK